MGCSPGFGVWCTVDTMQLLVGYMSFGGAVLGGVWVTGGCLGDEWDAEMLCVALPAF